MAHADDAQSQSRPATLLIVGDSHIASIERAHGKRADRTVAGHNALVSRYAVENHVKAVRGVTLSDTLNLNRSAAQNGVVILSVGGNHFNVFGMLQHPKPFDFYEPDAPDLPLIESSVFLPVQVIEDIFAPRILKDRALLERYQASGSGRYFVLAPPPPKADTKFMEEKLDTRFKDDLGDPLQITPASVRLKLWRLQVRLMRSIYAEREIAVLPPPIETLTPAGFLSPDFYGADATHANAGYGEKVLDLIDSTLRDAA